ncbi:hypothetical protein NCLIV_061070 [Neospora caninum Liverpool]|uniref:Probable protein arginine N-methyltransferase n=1 Tax=Neospora caninum (strain Liverpool) TaxID=572307 RepID=F0VPN6_NEOCL|nr:hypothetical protein NCLIV_061070 [Neospora caninum Liverpool]CBZ55683.1 hypothetical protein NCLIV_061070 [Neospora caninum Liverpool]CEL70425.1 TPA: Probable protein arginine N-methyltransferase [Neospora caninum Liverpool]|eukprot:XP_003885709.1 hypothetical protein NCLIV_061070 [Neospora caninum Liverpool]
MSSNSHNATRPEGVNGRVVVPTGGSRRENSGSGSRNAAGQAAAVLPCDEETKAAFAKDWKDLEQENLSSADYYFNSYAHFGIHEEMIKDSVRTGCYQRAICQNAHLFANKVVLDVGSGTGILSLFAARAGAKHVYGIECSEIVNIARKIVKENHMEDRITFVQGKAEEVSLPVDKVDIIISEWMGYFLLYESMLDTVLFCRDKWLKPGGMIFPDKAALYVAAIEDADYKEEKIGYWGNVYGFNFSCVRRCVMEEPIVDTVDENAVATTSCCVLKLDLATCTKEDLDFCAPYQIALRRKDFLHALIAWFDVWFSQCHKPVVLSTGPHCRYTHWKQTVFYMEDVLVADVGDKVEGMIAVKKSKKNPRDLDIKISYSFKPPQEPVAIENTQFYRLR